MPGNRNFRGVVNRLFDNKTFGSTIPFTDPWRPTSRVLQCPQEARFPRPSTSATIKANAVMDNMIGFRDFCRRRNRRQAQHRTTVPAKSGAAAYRITTATTLHIHEETRLSTRFYSRAAVTPYQYILFSLYHEIMDETSECFRRALRVSIPSP